MSFNINYMYFVGDRVNRNKEERTKKCLKVLVQEGKEVENIINVLPQ